MSCHRQTEVQEDSAAVAGSNRHKPYQGLKEMFHLYTCSICGKEFIVRIPQMWVYKGLKGSKKVLFCSYGCMRKFQREKENEIQKRKTVAEAEISQS